MSWLCIELNVIVSDILIQELFVFVRRSAILFHYFGEKAEIRALSVQYASLQKPEVTVGMRVMNTELHVCVCAGGACV